MGIINITEDLKESLLKDSKYVRDGYIIFNNIRINNSEAVLSNDGVELFRMSIGNINFDRGDSITLNITDGSMKLDLM